MAKGRPDCGKVDWLSTGQSEVQEMVNKSCSVKGMLLKVE